MAPLTKSLLSLLRRTPDAIQSVSALAKRTALSPMAISDLQRRADVATNGNYNPGTGARPADSFNNNIFLVLFAIIAAAMAMTGYWFFFIAKRGGFQWKENDWDDYKSTVLRRKGPDGKTLSNATKSTKLGGGSVVPKWAADDSSVGSKSDIVDAEGQRSRPVQGAQADPEFYAYRHEKPAGVGGLNKPAEGSHYDYTNSDPSTASGPASKKPNKKEQKEKERRAKEMRKKPSKENHSTPSKQTPAGAYPPSTVHTASSHESKSYYGVPQDSPSAARNSQYSGYRVQGLQGHTVRAVPEERSSRGPSHSYRESTVSQGQGSPQRIAQHRYDEEDRSSYAGRTDDSGTKSYVHHIPGLTNLNEVGIHDSVSQVGANNGPPKRYSGFRRT